MQQGEEEKRAMSRPICPRPLYFNKAPQESPAQSAPTLFGFYCEQLNAKERGASLLELQGIFKLHMESELGAREGGCEGRRSGITQANERGEEPSWQKGDQVVEEGLEIQQKNNYSKFLKRSTANDTKNIPKNFGKAIISFIQKNQKVAVRCIRRYHISLDSFIRELKQKKKILHSIRELRSLWLEDDFVYARPFRELSLYFLRRAGHRYIFGSRVSDFGNHLKYRYRIMKALKCPRTFNSIKI